MRTERGTDSRFVVTNLAGSADWLYETVYCAGGRAGNLMKAHKRHLASDRTACAKASANQFRLLVRTAASWLLHSLRGLAPKTSIWRDAQFDSLRLALVKLAARVKLSLPSSCPCRDDLTMLPARLHRLPP